MVPKHSHPPTHHHPHLTTTPTPAQAQQHLATFLSRTQTHSHLHPDSLLSSSGISFSVASGPRGGLALHHLRRIEAGLRGENLIVETEEELDELFGEARLPDGDDTRVDRVIEGAMKKGKRKRKREEVEEWAEETSSQIAGAGTREIESFATTPLHRSDWQWQSQEQGEYELAQQPWEGEVAEREGAAKRNGDVPDVVEHDGDGAEVKPSKEARKAAKKARRKEEARKKGKG